MATVTLITGGARSGKSTHALHLALEGYTRRTFVATAVALDEEMAERIAQHRDERGSAFVTVEEPMDLAGAVLSPGESTDVVLVDCITVWLGNLFHRFGEDLNAIDGEIAKLESSLLAAKHDVILVTNEVGWGIVPLNAMARAFRDKAGEVNRRVAALAERVVLCCCGIPVTIKGVDHG